MRRVRCVFATVRPTSLKRVVPASVLKGETPMLVETFHKALLQKPEGFRLEVGLEGFPLIHLEWSPACQTAGVLSFPPFVHRPNLMGPEVLSLLVNGLESPEDLTALAKRCPLRADMWQDMLNTEKPLAFNLLFTVGRLREPATITVINAFANSYFALFGTNEVPEAAPGA